jgi:hypothetical protein
MSPRPAIFCGFQQEDADTDPGLTLALTSEEREIAAIISWSSGNYERRAVEVDYPSSVEDDPRLAAVLHPSAYEGYGMNHRELRIAAALVEGAALLRTVTENAGGDLQTTMADYDYVRGLLCSSCVKPNQELCDPLTVDMVNRANVYLEVKLGNDRSSPFRATDLYSRRPWSTASPKRGDITRRELADLGNRRSQLLAALIEYLQRTHDGYAHCLQLGWQGSGITEREWSRLPASELTERLTTWSSKQVRTHFDRLKKTGLITARRLKANGPILYELPEELANANSPYSSLPSIDPLTQN